VPERVDHQERLSQHPAVAAVWSAVSCARTTTIVPADGCFDLIVRRRADGSSAAHVYRPIARAHVVVVDNGDAHFGVRLRPGFGSALLKPGVLEAAVGTDDLEGLVVDAVNSHRQAPHIVEDFVAAARWASGAVRIDSFDRHERQLQRACRRWLGLTPKAFLRIERAWGAHAAITQGTPLADVAADLGYTDQAHLTRDVRQLLGTTPGALKPAVGFRQDAPPPRR
jgi:hypothetical protein